MARTKRSSTPADVTTETRRERAARMAKHRKVALAKLRRAWGPADQAASRLASMLEAPRDATPADLRRAAKKARDAIDLLWSTAFLVCRFRAAKWARLAVPPWADEHKL
jgi:hypothetical protein